MKQTKAKLNNLYMLRSTRVNANNACFESLKLVDLAYLNDYTSSTRNAKTIKTAVNKMNKTANERYAQCSRGYQSYELLGKIKTDKEVGYTILANTVDELKTRVKDELCINLES